MVLGDDMKKIIFVFIALLLLTGCTCDYEVKFNNNSVDEKISIDIPSDMLVGENPNASVGDTADYIINNDINSLINGEAIYDKKVTDKGDYINTELSYTFKDNQYKNLGYVLNNCFENVYFEHEKGYKIHLSGQFYCLYTDSVEITIKSDNNIKSANGAKSNGSYHWTIDEGNYNNVDIEIEISNHAKAINYIFYVIVAIVLIALFYFGYNLYINIASSRDVNRV